MALYQVVGTHFKFPLSFEEFYIIMSPHASRRYDNNYIIAKKKVGYPLGTIMEC